MDMKMPKTDIKLEEDPFLRLGKSNTSRLKFGYLTPNFILQKMIVAGMLMYVI